MTNEEIVELFVAIAASQLSRERVEQRLRTTVSVKNKTP